MHTDVGALNGGLGGTETKTDILVPTAAGANLLALRLRLGVDEDVRLLLERTFRLDGQLGRHCCENSVRRGSEVELGDKFVAKGGCRGPAVVDVDVGEDLFEDGGYSSCECAMGALAPFGTRLGLSVLVCLHPPIT